MVDRGNGKLYIGVDTGGTFTDLVVMDSSDRVLTSKAPTTPRALEKGVFAALELVAAERGESLEEMLSNVESFGHGTTQATNALIERREYRVDHNERLRRHADYSAVDGFTAGMPTESLGQFKSRSYPAPIIPVAGDDIYISISSEVSPVLGEYERTATTVLNSYLGPTAARYLERLESSLQARGMAGSAC